MKHVKRIARWALLILLIGTAVRSIIAAYGLKATAFSFLMKVSLMTGLRIATNLILSD